MKRILAAVALAATLVIPAAHAALAADPHSGGSTGQPSQSCQDTNPPAFPGNTGNSPGSAFNGSAGAVYANPDAQGGTSSGNSHVVAQYDVACFQQTQH
jgi:opacity protein-like surface antigen